MIILDGKPVVIGVNDVQCWERTQAEILQIPGAPQLEDDVAWKMIVYLFRLWVGASAPLNKKKFSGKPDQPLVYTQVKIYRDERDLAVALFNNYRAQNNVIVEEKLAVSVISKTSQYEEEVLDPLMQRIFMFIQMAPNSQTLAEMLSASDFYGDLPRAKWNTLDWDQIQTDLNSGEALERLFRKVANIHLLGRVGRKFGLNVDSTHRDVLGTTRDRDNAYQTLDMEPQIQRLRQGNAPVWAGLSGSSGDIIAVAIALEITDPYKLNCLAWAAFAFFHFMPTSYSPTHTFHEVMMGAKAACAELAYDTVVVRYPTADFLSTTQKPLGHPDLPITNALQNPPPGIDPQDPRMKYLQRLSQLERR
jgi:hypothetical protein